MWTVPRIRVNQERKVAAERFREGAPFKCIQKAACADHNHSARVPSYVLSYCQNGAFRTRRCHRVPHLAFISISILQEIDRVLVHLSHAPVGKEVLHLSPTSRVHMALRQRRSWRRQGNDQTMASMVPFSTSRYFTSRRKMRSSQLMETVCANWSSEALGPLLYIRMLENKDGTETDEADLPQLKLIYRVLNKACLPMLRGVSFCIVRINCPSPHLAIFHLAFFQPRQIYV